ncbi:MULTISPECIES: alpha-L-fucosidase [unclassified Lentimonas]|uniref:alpha-L-fucosidase n=1 Tax=unclassified Lentimonas TaxID=2630993 RepID=UPI00132187B4|nr:MULTISPECIES: alpha-L-fucosidase [unclassified Lentimonas]CAA6690005.1 Alpha-L-fucosidase (EC [Lentimonas sp. CC10]CAA6691080.1 Alpha-L-fucosidase (EC [Lentimonas sp. CC19]CAA7069306.1 Alpha-L-fucosidase (EC [Lentimonas sp. CC11]
MKRLNISLKLLIITLGMALHTVVSAQVVPTPSADKSTGRAAWLDEAKYGMFIHWGVYSTLANGEWVMARSKIPVAEYKEMAAKFNPVKFNADEWVAVAKNAGMKYITITSKHHDGFAMFDSDVTDYNIVDYTPFKRDVLQELKEACDKAGIKLGFYYSQTQDWEFPGGAGRKWDPAQKGDFRNYIDTKSLPQLKEIMTKYAPTHIWFDTPHSDAGLTTTPELAGEFVDVIREANPDTIINSRLMFHGNQIEGLKPEQYEILKEVGVDFLSYRDRTIPPHSPWEYWETCMTLNGAWGYNANDNNWKSPQMVVMQLVEVVSKGGAFLLNVGPTAEGLIPAQAIQNLETAGEWLKVNGESVYGAQETIFEGEGQFITRTAAEQAALNKEALATGAGKKKKGHKQKDYAWLATGRDGKLYLHFFRWPTKPFVLHGFDVDKVTNAYFLADPSKAPVKFTQEGGKVVVELPAKPLDELNTVLCLTLD